MRHAISLQVQAKIGQTLPAGTAMPTGYIRIDRDAIPGLNVGYVLSNSKYNTNIFMSRHERKCTGAIASMQHVDVGMTQTRRFDIDQGMAGL